MFKIVKNNFYKKLNNHNNKKIDLDTQIDIIIAIKNGNYSNVNDYKGFGGFNSHFEKNKIKERLQSLISAETLDRLIDSITSAYFTPKEVMRI
jgi:hypothetical protein